jgi:hypothetical protein
MTTDLTIEEIQARIARAERALARCGDAYLQKTLRETIRHWQQVRADKVAA